jgi:hypothetical protein
MKKMMMMLVMATVALTASAQNEVGQLTLQPKIGLNLANLTNVEVISNSFTKETESGNLKGDFAIGVEAEYGVAKKFSVAAGILYSRQGTGFGTLKIYGGPDGSASEGWDKNERNLDYLNIPIVANFYFAKGWAVKAGIQPGFLLSAKAKIDGVASTENVDKDIKDDCKTFDLAIPLGISYEFSNFVVDGRYNLGLTKINKNGDESNKNNVIQFTFGYKFSL